MFEVVGEIGNSSLIGSLIPVGDQHNTWRKNNLELDKIIGNWKSSRRNIF